jgi:hypothetical protein
MPSPSPPDGVAAARDESIDVFVLTLLHLAGKVGADDDRLHEEVCAASVLLRASLHERLARALDPAATAPIPLPAWWPHRDAARRTLDRVRHIRERLETTELPYVLGAGPLDRIASQLDAGEIDGAEAERRASVASVTQHVAPLYAGWFCWSMVSLTHRGEWRQALRWHRLLLAATRALPPTDENARSAWLADSTWVELVIAALSFVPDARLLDHAREAGERAAAATAERDPRWHALTLHRLGVLHFDPYQRGRDVHNFSAQRDAWERHFFEEHGADAWIVPRVEWRMPDLADALRIAEAYLRRAASLRMAHDRGESLKALVHVLEWQEGTGQLVDARELVGMAHEALALLDGGRTPQHAAHLRLTLAGRDGNKADFGTVHDLRRAVSGQEPRVAEQLLRMGAAALAQSDSVGALEALMEGRWAFDQPENPDSLRQWRMQVIELVGRSLAGGETPWPEPGGWTRHLDAARERAGREAWSRDRLGGTLLRIAILSTNFDEERVALPLLAEVERLLPERAARHAEAFRQERARLLVGAGRNAVRAQPPRLLEAMDAYASALALHVALGNRSDASELLERVIDLLERGDPAVAMRALALLEDTAFGYERLLGEAGMLDVQNALALVLRRRDPTNASDLLTLQRVLAMGKGLQFGVALRRSAPLRIDPGTPVYGALERVRLVEQEPASSRPEASAFLDEERVLVTYIRPGEPAPGATQGERLANLEHRFDEALRRARLAAAGRDPVLRFSAEEIGRAIGERTALIDYFHGPAADGNLTVYGVVHALGLAVKVQTRFDIPAGPQMAVLDGHTAIFDRLAERVLLHRAALHQPPENLASVTDGAAALLDRWAAAFGNLPGTLPVLRQGGLDHLCIVPHGSMRFHPMHLLGPRDQPIASDWIVTYLPCVSALFRAPATRLRPLGVTAVAKSFTDRNPRGLGEMTESLAEAETIASLFDCEPVLEEEATRAAVLERLGRYRYAHVSTHGAANPFAPSRHALVVAPDAAGNDLLFAHEIEALDLTGVDVVTLSACQSALGRFDVGDNLGGLAAALMTAGVRTVVATLWDAEVISCRIFFSAFYRALHAKRPKLDAFRAAQNETRQQRPEYRDWGAFYLTGDWR